MLAQFEADVAATGSEKEQRFIIRKLLMQSGMFCVFGISGQAHVYLPPQERASQFLGAMNMDWNHDGIYTQSTVIWCTGVDDLQTALQLNFKPVVSAVVNVNSYEQRTGGKQLPVDQQGGDMGLSILSSSS